MYDLLSRTISQGIQAFLPIAFCLTWLRRAGDEDALRGLRWGIVASVPATAAAAYWLQASSSRAQWEAALAVAALAPAVWFARCVWSGASSPSTAVTAGRRHASRLAFAAATALIIARQAMEIAIVSAAALQSHMVDPILAITGAVAAALIITAVWLSVGRRLSLPLLHRATAVFAALFVGQLGIYAFHESAEAGVLPWSDVLHVATEPYGPDGIYGRYLSILLFVVPLAAVAAMRLLRRRSPSLPAPRRTRTVAFVTRVAVGVAVVFVAATILTNVVRSERATSSPATSAAAPSSPATSPAAPSRDMAVIAASPHLLFRHTAIDQNYSRLSVAPLDARDPAARAAADFACERVAYAAGRGICLAANRGVFNTYTAIFFDQALHAIKTIKLDGSPSRTRVSADGRVGAFTVFVAGTAHGYASTGFSTKTTIVDMNAGEPLADLEQFTTWRDGVRFKATDFNFWGVTFARDSNTFYATLRTASGSKGATTYLVRGDLGLRTLTVLRENVECPSLSPDNRLIAFKKRVGPDTAPWRLYVLDVATLVDRPITTETRSIDDQIEWLDNGHMLYASSRSSQSPSQDVWVAAVDDSAPPRVFLAQAESPIVVR